MAKGRLIRAGRLRLDHLEQITRRPQPFEQGDGSFWTDPYVSDHVLAAHLDPHTDDASRRPAHILATIEMVEHHLRSTSERDRPVRVLDLGCGPGLYAIQFAARGYDVTGIDFSPASIVYARTEAEREGHEIAYTLGNVLETDFGGPYDVITMIYGEFCTFSQGDQRALLRRMREALALDGLLVLDVFTEAYARHHRSRDDWYVSTKDGFWDSSAHLVLERSFFYAQQSASVASYVVIDGSGSYRRFNIWWRHYESEEIRGFLAEEGFAVEAEYPSLWGEPTTPEDHWIGLYCRRQRE